jgi:hypothetical protein
MKLWLGWITLAAGLACLILGIYFWDQARKRSTYSNYTLRVEYQKLPADDEEIRGWLARQPGFQKAEVSRAGDKVTFDLTFDNPPPDLLATTMKHCEENGYVGRVGYVGGFGPYR